MDSQGWVNVYTDGCCLNNGLSEPKAGVGVFFRDGHSLNVSEPCKGRATSNNAEITAVTRAAQQALRGGFYKLRIHTDSEFVVNCATKWIRVWERNGWKTEGNQPVVNRVELQEMIYSVRQLNQVEFVHVPGHSGVYGNEQAHKLANAGAARR